MNFYIKPKDSQYYDIYAKYMTQATTLGATHLPSRFASTKNTSPVYAYRFDWDEEPSQYGFDLSIALGAAHALEIPFVFGDFKLSLGKAVQTPFTCTTQRLLFCLLYFVVV